MGWVVNAIPRQLYPRERPDNRCIGGRVSPRASLDGRGISRPPAGFNPRTVHPVVSRYTDYAIPAHPHTHTHAHTHIYKLAFRFGCVYMRV